jgi:hypothetical protein
MIAHVWSGTAPGPDQDYLVLDPASGTDPAGTVRTTKYNDFQQLHWLGLTRGTTPVFADSSAGRWQCIEMHVRLNDPGEANGVFEVWVNGSPDARKAALNWASTFRTYGINAIFVENYWNAGAPQPEERYIDNLVISRARIGC